MWKVGARAIDVNCERANLAAKVRVELFKRKIHEGGIDLGGRLKLDARLQAKFHRIYFRYEVHLEERVEDSIEGFQP